MAAGSSAPGRSGERTGSRLARAGAAVARPDQGAADARMAAVRVANLVPTRTRPPSRGPAVLLRVSARATGPARTEVHGRSSPDSL